MAPNAVDGGAGGDQGVYQIGKVFGVSGRHIFSLKFLKFYNTSSNDSSPY